MKRSVFKNAIKRRGALTRLVGGKPSEHEDRVHELAEHGTSLQKKEANFYLNILKKKRKSPLTKRMK